MISALVPIWILGGSILGLLLLNVLFKGGRSAMRNEVDSSRSSSDMRRSVA